MQTVAQSKTGEVNREENSEKDVNRNIRAYMSKFKSLKYVLYSAKDTKRTVT